MPLDGRDGLIAVVLGLFASAFIWWLSYPGVHPDAWNECAVAAGIRPPTTLLAGHWRLLARGVYSLLGVAAGGTALGILGKVSAGVLTAFGYLLCREMLAILTCVDGTVHAWTRRRWRCFSRQISVVAALLLLCADPVWTIGQTFSPVTLMALEFLLSACLFADFLRSGSMRPLYCAALLLGFFGSVSPLGMAMPPVFCLVVHLLLVRGHLPCAQLFDPLTRQISKWILVFNWATGLLIGVVLNVGCFLALDGLAAIGGAAGNLPLTYALELWHAVTQAASSGAWIVWAGVVAMPFVLAVALLRRATDTERFLDFSLGLFFFLFLCLAYSQVAALRSLWFWRLSGATTVNSSLLLVVGSVMSVLTIAGGLAVLVVDVYCRNYRWLAAMLNPDGRPIRPHPHSRGMRVMRVMLFVGVALLLLAGALPGRWQPKTARMLQLISDFTHEIVDEAGDARWLFTDGQFDCGIELEAVRRHGLRGGPRCIPLMRGRQARSDYALRQLMTNQEDRLCAAIGGRNVLRTWQQDKPGEIAASALMLGLDAWKACGGKDDLSVSGVLARPAWPSEAARETGVRRAMGLIEEILALYGAGGLGGGGWAGRMLATSSVRFRTAWRARRASAAGSSTARAIPNARGNRWPSPRRWTAATSCSSSCTTA
ncbi:MAG: hypothetical protein ACI4Q3_09865 [Kiritimatiellia bacterium]